MVLFLLAFASEGAEEARGRVGISLETSHVTYPVGAPIRLTLRVYNYTGQSLALDFRNGQRFDFEILDSQGNEVWRWPGDKFFTQALGQETIGPDGPELVYRAEFTGELRPGNYFIKGELTSVDSRFSAEISVVIQ